MYMPAAGAGAGVRQAGRALTGAPPHCRTIDSELGWSVNAVSGQAKAAGVAVGMLLRAVSAGGTFRTVIRRRLVLRH
jgi:hypothetical protein